ncbi:MAG: o-succinylbenzoate--CoA ligase [Chloroflexi bacterium]|nr:o-succinylbenzoate--CoA ligase [Chloroflexota bacterium]
MNSEAPLLPDWLTHRAAVLPRHPAIVAGGEIVTYRELHGRALRLAGALAEMGAGPGRLVGLLAPNSLAFAETVHAAMQLGAILLPLNLRLTAEELAYQLRDAGAEVLLCTTETADAAAAAATRAGVREPVVLPVEGGAAIAPRETHAPDDVHSIIYTSGTTGSPKGAALTYGNYWASAAGSAFNIGVSPGDRWLACMPLFHVGGLSILLRSVIYGTTAVIHERFEEAAVNRALREDGVSLLSVVPTMLERMLVADDRPFPPSVRCVLVGGGPVSEELLRRAMERGLPVVQTYGLTEAASQVATLAPGDALAHLGSAGKPLVTTEMRVDSPPGEPGEILVRGATVSPGYWRDGRVEPQGGDGWLHTGDIGRLDGEGFLFVLDRRDDLIVSGGENVYPAEVEAALAGHPAVRAAAVVGIPDQRWGQVVAAAVVVEPGFDPGVLDGWLEVRLAPFKRPRRFVAVEELPMTANGKVQRRFVRELFPNG